MKKFLLLGLVLFSGFVLSSCVEEKNEVIGDLPVFATADTLTKHVGDEVDFLEGITVSDTEDGDLTASVLVTNSKSVYLDGVKLTTVGEYTIKYSVIDSDDNTVLFERTLIVLAKVVEEEEEDESKEDEVNLGNCVSYTPGMTITFCDDFNFAVNADATGVDMDKWGYELGDGSAYGIPGWGNSELEYYKEENSYVEDGNLYIEALLENFGGKKYTSSKLVTDQKFSQTYGRFEARIQLPVGTGLWPAFWMMPEDDVYGTWARSGEIDIMEAKGRLPQHASGAIHYGGNWPNNRYQSGGLDLAENKGIDTFHVYAVEWTSTSIKWFIDNTLVWEATDWYSDGNEFPAPFDQDFYLILNLAIGGNFDSGRAPSDSLFDEPVLMVVDFVRVFQFDE